MTFQVQARRVTSTGESRSVSGKRATCHDSDDDDFAPATEKNGAKKEARISLENPPVSHSV